MNDISKMVVFGYMHDVFQDLETLSSTSKRFLSYVEEKAKSDPSILQLKPIIEDLIEKMSPIRDVALKIKKLNEQPNPPEIKR
jgi:hypothetical protein